MKSILEEIKNTERISEERGRTIRKDIEFVQ